MQKKLVTIGNSVGLVIERSMLQMMGLKRGSIVKLETDGRTLIVKNTGEVADTSMMTDNSAQAGENQVLDVHSVPGGLSTAEISRVIAQAPRVFHRLTRSRTIPIPCFRALYHQPVSDPDPRRGETNGWVSTILPYDAWVDSNARYDATPAEFATMRRFEACLQAMEEGATWEQATAHALETVPMLREEAECRAHASMPARPRFSLDELLEDDD
jgi:antitoxin component of MazEF toxin-antitoxin module